jgi:hypothetical protein
VPLRVPSPHPTPNREPADTSRDRWVEPFPIELAAARLRIRPSAVRRQLRHRRLEGFEVGGRWWVWLPVAAVELPVDEHERTAPPRRSPAARGGPQSQYRRRWWQWWRRR